MTQKSERRDIAIWLATARGFVTVETLASECLVTRHTARRDLRVLVAKGTLTSHGEGQETYYILADPPNVDPPGQATRRRQR